jgi:hypothetical protein
LKIGIIDLSNIGENPGRLFSNVGYQIAISNSRGLGLTAAYFFGVLEKFSSFNNLPSFHLITISLPTILNSYLMLSNNNK